MNWRIGGAILFASMLFVVELSIKGIAFDQQTIWFELGPSLALWATGILFSLAVSEETKFRGTVEYKAIRKPSGSGFDLDYRVRLPDQPDFTPKYLYLFVVVMTAWIICLLLSQEVLTIFAATKQWTTKIQLFTAITLVFGGASVGLGLAGIAEASS